MFGMLDYRAHKLFVLLYFPVRVCIWIGYFANIAISTFLANLISFNLLFKILVAYLIFEGFGMLLMAFWTFIIWLFKRAFFWVIDVVPSEGENREEAHAVVLTGSIVRLSKIIMNDIGNMTFEDADEFSRRSNGFWGKVLFKARRRVGKRLIILYQHHAATGKQPKDLSREEVKALVGHLEFSKFERVVASEFVLRSALAFALIVTILSVSNWN